MELRQHELAQRICAMTGQGEEMAEREVKVAIQRVFHWAAYTDKYGGSVQVGIHEVSISEQKLISLH